MEDARMSVEPKILMALLSIVFTVRSAEHMRLMNTAIIATVIQPIAKLSEIYRSDGLWTCSNQALP